MFETSFLSADHMEEKLSIEVFAGYLDVNGVKCLQQQRILQTYVAFTSWVGGGWSKTMGQALVSPVGGVGSEGELVIFVILCPEQKF